jgi:hypothetical protein
VVDGDSTSVKIRRETVDFAAFVQNAKRIAGIRQISVIGSVTTRKPNPKDRGAGGGLG